MYIFEKNNIPENGISTNAENSVKDIQSTNETAVNNGSAAHPANETDAGSSPAIQPVGVAVTDDEFMLQPASGTVMGSSFSTQFSQPANAITDKRFYSQVNLPLSSGATTQVPLYISRE